MNKLFNMIEEGLGLQAELITYCSICELLMFRLDRSTICSTCGGEEDEGRDCNEPEEDEE